MSKAEILEEITKLTAEERDLFKATLPSEEEKSLLDGEWNDYLNDPDEGSSWAEVEARLR